MPFDSNGGYGLPAGSTAVLGAAIVPSTHNIPIGDIALALNLSFLRDGRAPATGDFAMAGHKITGVGDASSDQDAATYKQLTDAVAAALAAAAPTGKVSSFLRTSAPTGWVPVGRTIGSVSSGATYASADTQALFNLLWADFTDTTAPIFTSAGSASTRGASAAADWAANKRMQAGILQGEFIRVWDDSRGVDPGRAMGTYQASQNNAHTHSVSDPGHVHGVTDPGHSHINGLGSGSFLVVAAGGSGYTAGSVWASPGITTTPTVGGSATGISIQSAATGISVQSAGGSEARPRNVALLTCVKL